MNIDLGCLYLGLLWIKPLRTFLYSLLRTYILTSIWSILGVKFLGYYISFCLDGCTILLAVMPATWCQPPNLGTRPYSFSQNRTLSTSKILGSSGGLPYSTWVKWKLPGLAFKTPHHSILTVFPHVHCLRFSECSLDADDLVSLILGSLRTELREHRLAGLCNPWQGLAHSGTQRCLPNKLSMLIVWSPYL